MRWCCFKFWFYYRLLLACLAHFNWFTAIYVNCAFFLLWKSYDLLWFWMHFVLCSCFEPLRSENYLLVWIKLVRLRYTVYPDKTYKEIYVLEYGRKRGTTKSERDLGRIYEAEAREQEEEGVEGSHSSDEENVIDMQPSTSQAVERPGNGTSSTSELSSSETSQSQVEKIRDRIYNRVPGFAIIGEEEQECMEQIYIGCAVPSDTELDRYDTVEDDLRNVPPIPPPRRKRHEAAVETASQISGSPDEPDKAKKDHWYNKVIPKIVRDRFRRKKDVNDAPLYVNAVSGGSGGPESKNTSGTTEENSPDSTSSVEVLRPDFTNRHDAKTEKERARREKKDRKALGKRLRERRRAELAVLAKIESRKRLVSSSIELLLQLLRMICSFALLVGNIRRTFLLASFRYVKPGQNDNLAIQTLFRITVFLDVFLFSTSMIWAYCLQWHLCCRLGLLKFWLWTLTLVAVGGFIMIFPMSYVQQSLDPGWCRFYPNSTLARFQPNW